MRAPRRTLAAACSLATILAIPCSALDRVRCWAPDAAAAVLPGYDVRPASELLVGDFNGDTLGDLAVVVPRLSFPFTGPSEVHLYFGPLTARDPDVVITTRLSAYTLLSGTQGDFDGDKIDDLLIGANPRCSQGESLARTNAGTAVLIHGRTSWPATWDLLATPPDATFEGSDDLARAIPLVGGDLDGDEKDEIFIGTGRNVRIYYGRSRFAGTYDLDATPADLLITGTVFGDDARVVDLGAGRDLLVGNSALFRAPGHAVGILDVTSAHVRILGLDNRETAQAFRPQPAAAPLLLVPDHCLANIDFYSCPVPYTVKAVDVSRDGVINFTGPTDPPEVVASILGARLARFPTHLDVLDGGGAEVVLQSDTLPRFRATVRGGGLTALGWSDPLSGTVDARYGKQRFHVYGAGGGDRSWTQRTAPLAAGDLTGDLRPDLVTYGLTADGSEAIFVLDGARFPQADTDITLHVDPVNGNDTRDGLSWATSARSLQPALRRAEVALGAATVKLAAGTLPLPAEGVGGGHDFFEREYDDEIVFVGQGSRVLGGYPPGGGTRDPTAWPTVIDVEPPHDGQVGRVAVGSVSPDPSGPFALLDGVVTKSTWLNGPAIVSNSRLTGAWANSTVWGTCDASSGACSTMFGSGDGRQGAAVLMGSKSTSAWAWNNLITDSRGYDMLMCVDFACGSAWGLSTIVHAGGGGHVVGCTMTSSTSSAGIMDGGFETRRAELRRNVTWANMGPEGIPQSTVATIEHNIVPPWPRGLPASNWWADPVLVGDARLSQLAAGQPAQSPAVDAGDVPASAACHPLPGFGCLSDLTTRTDGIRDEGIADLGFHATASPFTAACLRLPARAIVSGCTVSIEFHASVACDGARLAVDVHRGDSPGFVPTAATLVRADAASPVADVVPANGSAWYRLVLRGPFAMEAVTLPFEAHVDTCSGATPPPGTVPMLLLVKDGDDVRVRLTPAAGADFHRLLEAPLDALAARSPFTAEPGPDGVVGSVDDVGACTLGSLDEVVSAIAAVRAPTGYIAVGVNAAGDGSAGWDSRLVARAASVGCP